MPWHRTVNRYCLYLEISEPLCSYLISYHGPRVINHTVYNHKMFSENTCAIIDEWHRNHRQSNL